MLTSTTRELFLLQGKSHVTKLESMTARSAARNTSTTTSSAMVFVDADAEQVKMIDPCVAFGIPAHIASRQTQLHLGNKGINAIHPNTQLFVSLESLVLSDNNLTQLKGLLPSAAPDVTTAPSGCMRLKRVLLANNRLTTLQGDLAQLRYVEVLLLGNNLLSNMERVSKQLQHLHYLTQLDLSGNPVCEEQSYRLYMIQRHPSLEQLDRKSISAEERKDAAAMFGRSGGHNTRGSHGISSSSSVTSLPMLAKSNMSDSGRGGPAAGGTGGHENDTKKSSYVFGSSYVVPSTKDEHRRPPDALSASAALLESKVRAIMMKRNVDELREKSKAQTHLDEVAERRQIFHTIWEWSGQFLGSKAAADAQLAGGGAAPPPEAVKGGKPAKGAPVVAAAPVAVTSTERQLNLPEKLTLSSLVTTDPHQSSLFIEKNKTLDALLERVRQIVNADSARRVALAEDLRKALYQMIPERPGDDFVVTFSQWKQDRLPAAVAQYLVQVSQSLFTVSEHAALQRMFGGDVATIDVGAWTSVVKELDDVATHPLSAAHLQQAFRAEFNLPSDVKKTGSGSKSKSTATTTHAVTVEQALQLLVRFIPFAAQRPAFFQALSADALKKGDNDSAKRFFRLSNEATDHLRLLEKNAGGAPATSTHRFVALTSL